MEIFHQISQIQEYLKKIEATGKTIGFVPTMGALHEGHASLVARSHNENDLTIASIFVNPTQFNNPEDLKKYPRTLLEDSQLLEKNGCDLLFAPSAEEMYQDWPKIQLNFGELENVMEGKFRKGHFNGVGIVVAKLFNIVKPDKAYFGLKDLQQVAVVNLLVKDLSFDLQIIPCATLREADGLAMSSRNRRLSTAARNKASKVYQSLKLGEEQLLRGVSPAQVQNDISTYFKQFPEFDLEYYEIVSFENLQAIKTYKTSEKTAICIAAYLDGVRLIDNILVGN